MQNTTRTAQDNQKAQLENEIARLKKKIEKYETIELKQNRFGLVWLDVPEAFEDDVENKLPILEEVPKLAINSKDDKATHLLIEGDNYHALTCLNYTHKGKIDVIYIDPPYNTGSDGFKYKDKRILKEYPDGTEVPVEHPLRHSYWISFMKKRLELAKDILKNSGLIFISIDDNEAAQLKLLCNEIFGEKNFVGNITIQGSANESNEGVMFQNVTEYLLCYAKNKSAAKINKINAVNEDWRSLNDAPSGLSTRKQMGYTIYYNTKTQDIIPKIDYNTNGDFSNLDNIYKDDKELLRKGYVAIRPKARNGVAWRWRWGKETLLERKSELKFRQNRNGDWVVEFGQSGFNAPRDYQEFGTGTTELKRIFDGKEMFNKPKSTELIKWVLEVGGNKSAVVLDFFAGSGTTGHATMELNEEDDGKRQFILITTNDEITNGEKHKIMDDVCYPRIIKVINGYGDKKGLDNSVRYFQTSFVGKNNILAADDADKIELAHNAGGMLAIAENTFDKVEQNDFWQIFENQKQYTAVYFREDFNKFDDFVDKIRKLKKPVVAYIFSWEKEFEFSEFDDDKNVSVKTIPQPILEIYKEIYNLI